VLPTDRVWTEPPAECRPLAFALFRLALEEHFDVPEGGLDMQAPGSTGQLISDWFDLEGDGELAYRWGGGHAAALVRVESHAAAARVRYCLPPVATGGLRLSLRPLWSHRDAWSAHLPWIDGSWREARLPLSLAPGEYILALDTARPWSNPDGADTTLWPEARRLGCALAAFELEPAATDRGGANARNAEAVSR